MRSSVPLWLRWWAFKAWFHRCPECGHRPDRHFDSPGPRWGDDRIARTLGIGQYGCRRCGHGAIAERDSRGGVGGVAGKVAQFNDLVPVGSRVLYWPGIRAGEGIASMTRTRAWLLGDHTPVVMVEGYSGGIALTHVCPLPPGNGGAS